MKIALKYLITVYLLAVSCNNHKIPTPSSDYMILDDVTFVKEFPNIFPLQHGIEVDIDLIGVKDFVIQDSILIAATGDKEGLWSFIALSDYKYLGSFLKNGQGPFEFLGLPFISQQTLNRDNGLSAYIYNFQRGELFKIDIDKSLKNKYLHITTQNDSLPPFLFNFAFIDEETFFCKRIDHNEQRQSRYLLKNGKEELLPAMARLNKASIRRGEDTNILSTITKYNKKENRIIEAPIGLNYINIYSLDGSFEKTVCIGSDLFNIGKIQEFEVDRRVYTFSDIRMFDDFFGVVYVGEERGAYLGERKKKPRILIFDWSGTPMAEVTFEHHFTSFDIDFTKGELYTLDLYSDEFYKYDFKTQLNQL